MKRALLILTIALAAGTGSARAQIYVTIRPAVPQYTRVVAPAPNYVWIEEDWEPRGNTYVFVGGHWAPPPQPGYVWRPGYWRKGPRGQYWAPGRWGAPGQAYGPGHGHGHGNGHGRGHGKGHGH